jgi:hypothetical protein
VQQPQSSLVAGLGEDAHQVGRAVVRYPEAASGRFYSKRDRQVSLPRSDRARNDHISSGLQELAAGEFHDLLAGDALECLPVELLEGLHVWKAGLLEAPFGGARFTRAHFHLQQFPEEVLVVPTAFSLAWRTSSGYSAANAGSLRAFRYSAITASLAAALALVLARGVCFLVAFTLHPRRL